MYLIGIVGDIGSFKTCYLTAILYTLHTRGYRVITTYHTVFSEYMPFATFATLPETIHHCYVGLDELGIGADSYDFILNQPRKMSQLITELRKRHTTAYYTVPQIGMIAPRIRRATEGLLLMEDIDRFKAGHSRDNCAGWARVEATDRYGYLKNRLRFYGPPFYALYDTDERVPRGYEVAAPFDD